MSFQFGATAGKPSEIRKALQDARSQQAKSLPDAFDDSEVGRERAAQVDRTRDELDGDLAEAAIAAAEAGLRKLKGYSGGFQVTVAGNDPGDGGTVSFSVSVVAAP